MTHLKTFRYVRRFAETLAGSELADDTAGGSARFTATLRTRCVRAMRDHALLHGTRW
jgi:hypothetical protein